MTTTDDTILLDGVTLHADVETFYRDGAWHTRRCDAPEPFASGPSRARMIAVGVEVARWNGQCHIIRDTAGNVVEFNRYAGGPYPSRSPATAMYRGLSA
ncbi:hypothetical protein [Kribbella sp. NPDC004875]|uniref:hypothetical protein n=1 Tax=Kribbella sp. NPDC004875 TaxID=3364107 RepID=UPI0036C6A9CB